jgi:hypothetical protein
MVLVLFALSFLIMIIGFVPWDLLGINFFLGWSAFLTDVPLGQWYFAESTTWFLLMAIVIGVVDGLSEREIVNTFMAGAGDMMSVVMIIAVARGVTVIMNLTNLSNLVLYSASHALQGTHGVVFAIGSYLLYFLCPPIPSTSGLGRFVADHGATDSKLGFTSCHDHGVLCSVWCREPDHANLCCHHGGFGVGACGVLHLVQICSQDRRCPLDRLHDYPRYCYGRRACIGVTPETRPVLLWRYGM